MTPAQCASERWEEPGCSGVLRILVRAASCAAHTHDRAAPSTGLPCGLQPCILFVLFAARDLIVSNCNWKDACEICFGAGAGPEWAALCCSDFDPYNMSKCNVLRNRK
jgi:hypothetical protein